MTPDQAIEEARKGALRPLYLLAGEEGYLEKAVLVELRQAAAREGVPGLNEDLFTAGEVGADRVLAAARTVPMLAKRRLVVVRGLERWEPRAGSEKADGKDAGKEALDRLAEYAKDPVPSTTLVLIGGTLDKRRRLFVSARTDGWLVSCDPLSRAEQPRFVERRVRELGCRVAPDTADAIAELAGPDLAPIADAIERLCLYVGAGGEVTEAAVAECVVRLRPSTVWELVGAVGRRDTAAALAALDLVYDPSDRGLRLVGVLAWSTRQLIKFQAAARSGLGPGEAAARAGAPPFKARELSEQIKRLRPADLERWMVALAKLDSDLKGGSRRPPKATLERAVLELCHPSAG